MSDPIILETEINILEGENYQLRKTTQRQAMKLMAILKLCRHHNSPAVNVGAHALASEVLAIIERGEA